MPVPAPTVARRAGHSVDVVLRVYAADAGPAAGQPPSQWHAIKA